MPQITVCSEQLCGHTRGPLVWLRRHALSWRPTSRPRGRRSCKACGGSGEQCKSEGGSSTSGLGLEPTVRESGRQPPESIPVKDQADGQQAFRMYRLASPPPSFSISPPFPRLNSADILPLACSLTQGPRNSFRTPIISAHEADPCSVCRCTGYYALTGRIGFWLAKSVACIRLPPHHDILTPSSPAMWTRKRLAVCGRSAACLLVQFRKHSIGPDTASVLYDDEVSVHLSARSRAGATCEKCSWR